MKCVNRAQMDYADHRQCTDLKLLPPTELDTIGIHCTFCLTCFDLTIYYKVGCFYRVIDIMTVKIGMLPCKEYPIPAP